MALTGNPFVKAINAINQAAGYFSGLAILAATLIIVEQVVVRYVLNAATVWQVETAVYLLIAATFLGSSYGLKEKAHINIDIVVILLPQRIRDRLDIVTAVIALLFCLFLVWRGSVMWWEAFEGGWRSSSLLSFPLVYPYALIPLGMFMTSLQYIVRIIELVRDLGEKEKDPKKAPKE
jgi:TRAP-type C4-dicarboxylate transport system permease small subunit